MIHIQMNLAQISSEEQYLEHLNMVDQLFDHQASPDSPDEIKLKFLLQIIKEYEDLNYPIKKTGIPVILSHIIFQKYHCICLQNCIFVNICKQIQPHERDFQ